MQEKIFSTISSTEQLNALKILHSLGWSNLDEETPEEYEEFSRYPYIKLYDWRYKKYTLCAIGSSVEFRKNVTEFYEAATCSNKTVSIKLNREYTAEISVDGIKVGCQTFPLSIAKEIYEAVKQIEE